MSKCKAIQYSDQMSCHECSLVWDMNDNDPPACKSESLKVVPKQIQNVVFANLRNQLMAGDHAIEMDDRCK